MGRHFSLPQEKREGWNECISPVLCGGRGERPAPACPWRLGSAEGKSRNGDVPFTALDHRGPGECIHRVLSKRQALGRISVDLHSHGKLISGDSLPGGLLLLVLMLTSEVPEERLRTFKYQGKDAPIR